jgi:hypothetical protein
VGPTLAAGFFLGVDFFFAGGACAYVTIRYHYDALPTSVIGIGL